MQRAKKHFGGLVLVFGFLTQSVAALFAPEMIATTIFSKVTLKKKFVLGYELDVLYLVLAVLMLVLGPGSLSKGKLIGLA